MDDRQQCYMIKVGKLIPGYLDLKMVDFLLKLWSEEVQVKWSFDLSRIINKFV